MVNKNIGVIIQARTSSSRFRNKILSKINNITILEILLLRLKKSKKIDHFVVAIPHEDRDSEIVKISKKCGYHIVAGSKHNLVARYYKAAKKYNIQNIIRITSDCPFIDKKLIDLAVGKFKKKNLDFLSNCHPPTYPDGFDIEMFKFKLLLKTHKMKLNSVEKEHLTQKMYKLKSVKFFNFRSKSNFSKMRLTLDYYKDYLVIKKILKKFNYDYYISSSKIVKFLVKNKTILRLNSKYQRNEKLNEKN